MKRLFVAADSSFVPNPLLDPTTQTMPVPAQPTGPSPHEERRTKMAEYAAEMRAAGHSRRAIAAKFGEANVSDAEAQFVINEVDLFAGMMGNPLPVDIDPTVREQVESQGPMLVTEALNKRIDPVETSEPKIGEAKQTAREMAERNEDPQIILQFLTNAGAPPDQARQIIEQLMEQTGGSQKKKRFSLRKK